MSVLLASSGVSRSAIAGPTEAEQALWRHATQAVHAIAQGRDVQAVQHTAAARAAKALPELDALVGLAALAGGRPKAARRPLASAIARKSADPLVYYWAARVELTLGHRAAALARLEQGLAIGSHRDELQAAYATVALAAGRRKAALGALQVLATRRSNLLDPGLWPTPRQGAVALLEGLMRGFPYPVALWKTQGHLYFEVGAVIPSLERFSRVLRKRPGDANALQMVARCLQRLGAAKLALASAENAYLRSPGSALTRGTLGRLLLEQGQIKRAATLLEAAAAAHPRDVELLLLAARACAQNQQPKRAARYYSYALRRDHRLPEAHFGLGLLAQQGGKKARAKLAFERALRLDPSKPRYYQAAAQQAQLRGDKRLARRLLAEARRAKRGRVRLEQFDRRLRNYLKRLRSTLHECDCAERGEICQKAANPACDKAARELGGPAGLLLQAHLALRQTRTKEAARLIARLSRALRVKALLLCDPKLFSYAARTIGGQRYEVRKLFPVAIVGPLPRHNRATAR